MGSQIRAIANRKMAKVAGVSGLLLTGAAANADTAAAITGAFSAAESNVGLAVAGLISLVAIVVGVTLLMGLFKRA